eukprot:6004054-Heterocapsa_arctica.AAC.1
MPPRLHARQASTSFAASNPPGSISNSWRASISSPWVLAAPAKAAAVPKCAVMRVSRWAGMPRSERVKPRLGTEVIPLPPVSLSRKGRSSSAPD